MMSFRILCPRCGTEAEVNPRRKRELVCLERTCQAATTNGEWDHGYGGEQPPPLRGGKP